MRYRVRSVSYCFPYETQDTIYNYHNRSLYGRPPLYGVLAPYLYVNRTMSEKEADDFLCEVIRRHPFVEGAMWLDILVEWFENNTSGIYHKLHIRNPNHSSERKEYKPTPIQWR